MFDRSIEKRAGEVSGDVCVIEAGEAFISIEIVVSVFEDGEARVDTVVLLKYLFKRQS